MNTHIQPRRLILLVWILTLISSAPGFSQVNETFKLTAGDASAGDSFGHRVAISGNYAIVGAISKDEPSAGSTVGLIGAAYMFQRNSSGSWTEIQKFLPAFLYVPETNFGASVTIDGDLAAVGAYFLANIQDAVYVYGNSGGTWNHLIRLYEPVKGFGNDIDLSGNRLIVGASVGGEGSEFGKGKAFIYEYSGETGYIGWTNKTVLESSDAPAANFFGSSVAISGDYAAVSASGDINTLAGRAVFVFERDASGNWTEVQKITSPGTILNDAFGNQLSMDGNRLVVGAAFAENGSGVNTGAVYVYTRSGSGIWTLSQTILASDGAQNDGFGSKVDIHENKIIAGSRRDDDNGIDSGSGYLYTYNGTSFIESSKYIASDASAGDQFGRDVAISDYYAIVGAPSDDDAGSSSGSAYIFQHRRLIPIPPRLIIRIFPNPNFGRFYIGAAVVQPFKDNPDEQLQMKFIQEKNTIDSNWEIIPTKATATIKNSDGKELVSRDIELPFLKPVDLTKFGPGIYYITIDTGELKRTVRVLVEKQ